MDDDLQGYAGIQSHGGISWPFCALVFAAPFVIPRQYYDYSVVSKEAVIQIGTMALMTFWMFGLIRTGRRVRFPAALRYIAVFLAYVWSTLFWAANPVEGFTVVFHWSICALAALIVANTVNKKHLLLAIFFSGVVVASIGLLQKYAGFDYFQQVIAPSSTFANKNFAAHYVAACLPLGFILTGKQRALTALGAALILAYVWTCKNDAAFLGIFAIVVFLCIRKPKIVAGLILGAMVLVYVVKPNGLEERIRFWDNAATMAAENPAGVGIGNYQVETPIYTAASNVRYTLDHPHNEYVELWTDTGLAGILLLVLLFAGVLVSINHNKAVIASIVCICVVSAFSFPAHLPNIPFVGACMVGAVSK